MTLKQYLFEGAAAGTPATGGNGTTPGGNTGALLVSKGGGTAAFTAAAAAHGACGLEFVTTATNQFNIGRFLAAAANDQMAFSGVFSYLGTGANNAPAANGAMIGAFRITGSETYVLRMAVSATNGFNVTDAAGAFIGGRSTDFPLPDAPGSKYRVEVVMTRGTGATGAVTVNLYRATSLTPLSTWTSSTATLGTAAINGIDIGMVSSNQAMTVRWDDLQFNDGGTTQIGPYDAGTTPFTFSLNLDKTSGETPYTQVATAVPTGATPATGAGRQYLFDFGDGDIVGPQAGATASHVVESGSWTATLTVTEP